MADSRAHSFQFSLDTFESIILRVGLIGAALLCFEAASRLWESNAMASRPEAAALSIFNHLAAFALLILSTRRQLSPKLGWAIPAALSLVLISTTFVWAMQRAQAGSHAPTTDLYLFADYGARLLRMGENPYTHDLFDAYRIHRAIAFDATPLQIDYYTGKIAYPALDFLLFVPFQWLGLPSSWIFPLFYVLTLVVLFIGAPSVARPLVLLPFFADERFLFYSLGGVSDIVWIFFLVMVIFSWRHETQRAIWFGLACSFKQHAWLLAPLLLIRLWKERDLPARERWQTLLKFTLPSLAVFLLLNAPFMLWDFNAWLGGVLEPFRGNLILLGQGLSSLTVLGYMIVPQTFFTLFVLVVYLVAIILYWRNYEQWPESLWLVPAITLWFAPRSLSSYWYFFPIPLLFALLRHGEMLALRPTQERLAWRWTRTSVASAGAAAAIALVVLGFGAYPPKLTARVLNPLLTRPDGAIEQLAVRVDNQTGSSLTPRFSVEHDGHQPLFWHIEDGPEILPSGQSALYNISTDVSFEDFSFASDARVIVSDTQNYGLRAVAAISGDTTVNYPEVIPNGEYRYWDEGRDLPLMWGSYSNPAETGSIQRATSADLEHSLQFELTPSEFADYSELVLEAFVPMPESPIEVWVKPPEDANRLPDLDIVYGFELVSSHTRVWVLFGDEQSSGALGDGAYYWMIQASRGSWNRKVLDLRQIYRDLHIPLEAERQIMPRLGHLEYPLVPLRFRMLLRSNQPTPLTAYFGPVRTLQLQTTDYDAMVRENLDHPETALLWEAAYQYEARNVELARQTYAQALADAPESAQVQFQVADFELRTLAFDQAIERYQRLIDANQLPGMAYKGIGWAQFGLLNYDAALEAFSEAARLLAAQDTYVYEPVDVADAYNGIGQVYLRRGQCFEAAIAFEQADTSAPSQFTIPIDELNACGPLFGTAEPEEGS